MFFDSPSVVHVLSSGTLVVQQHPYIPPTRTLNVGSRRTLDNARRTKHEASSKRCKNLYFILCFYRFCFYRIYNRWSKIIEFILLWFTGSVLYVVRQDLRPTSEKNEAMLDLIAERRFPEAYDVLWYTKLYPVDANFGTGTG